jgi:hypothetical protein
VAIALTSLSLNVSNAFVSVGYFDSSISRALPTQHPTSPPSCSVASNQKRTLPSRLPDSGFDRIRHLFYSNDKSSGYRYDSSDYNILEARLCELRRRALEADYKRPPNSSLQPIDFVSELLWALWNNSDPLPDSGFRLLLRASTKQWRRKLYDAVAAPDHANEEAVASAMGTAMARPRNQYGILVGEDEHYYAVFPTDVLDYGDGNCWVECQLRDKSSDRLLAILGWELERRESDGAWLVSSIDWQDFRGTVCRMTWHGLFFRLRRSFDASCFPLQRTSRRLSSRNRQRRVDAHLRMIEY